MKIPAFQASQAYGLAKSKLNVDSNIGTAQKTSASENPTDNLAFKTVHALADTIAKSETAGIAHMTTGADAHSVVEAIAAAELAVETAVTVRDKVVEAYQELIRMQI